MLRVVIINGSAGCGKDTFIYLCLPFSQGLIFSYSSVDKVKEIAKSLGWDGVKDEKGRSLLSDLKNLLVKYFDTPFKCLEERVNKVSGCYFNSTLPVLFLHIREPEEIERAKKAFNATTLLIDSDERIPKVVSNTADRNVGEYSYDVYYTNNGTLEELKEKCCEFMNNLQQRSDNICPL